MKTLAVPAGQAGQNKTTTDENLRLVLLQTALVLFILQLLEGSGDIGVAGNPVQHFGLVGCGGKEERMEADRQAAR